MPLGQAQAREGFFHTWADGMPLHLETGTREQGGACVDPLSTDVTGNA